MPYAAKHYPFENKDWFQDNYPADFVSEYVAQVRAWFYYMHVLGVLLFDKAPFKNVVVSGNVLASDGSKMAKSKHNFPDPHEIFDLYGADAVRFYLMASPLMKAEDLKFNELEVKEVYKKIILLLSNMFNFYELFSPVLENNNPSMVIEKKITNQLNNVLDRWITSKVHSLNQKVTNALEQYNTIFACNEFTQFINDLSTWYIRRSRNRFKSNKILEQQAAVHTLQTVLIHLLKLMAPFMPFITEEYYQRLRQANPLLVESIHLELWPAVDKHLLDLPLEQQMDQIRNIVSIGLEKRIQAKIPVKQTLSELQINGLALNPELFPLLEEELNVKKIKLTPSKTFEIILDTNISEDLRLEGLARTLMRKINAFRKELQLTIQNRIEIYYETESTELDLSIETYKQDISNAIQADRLQKKIPENVLTKSFQIMEFPLKIGIKIHSNQPK
jgi:isoleucyl-tRNA synthetase